MEYPRCGICNKIFRSLAALKSHHTTVHSNVQITDFSRKCNICQEEFKKCGKSKYNYHLRRHKNYMRCNCCGYVTTKKVDLQDHVQGHEDGRNFCSWCNIYIEQQDHTHNHHIGVESVEKQIEMSTDDTQRDFSVEKNDTEGTPSKVPLPDTSTHNTGGSIELQLSCDTLTVCKDMSVGQVLHIGGITTRKTVQGFSCKQNVTMSVKKNDDTVTFLLQASAMGQMFQQKLTKNWLCEFKDSQVYDPTCVEQSVVDNVIEVNEVTILDSQAIQDTTQNYYFEMPQTIAGNETGEGMQTLDVLESGVEEQEQVVSCVGDELQQLVAVLAEGDNEQCNTEHIPLEVALRHVDHEHVDNTHIGEVTCEVIHEETDEQVTDIKQRADPHHNESVGTLETSGDDSGGKLYTCSPENEMIVEKPGFTQEVTSAQDVLNDDCTGEVYIKMDGNAELNLAEPQQDCDEHYQDGANISCRSMKTESLIETATPGIPTDDTEQNSPKRGRKRNSTPACGKRKKSRKTDLPTDEETCAEHETGKKSAAKTSRKRSRTSKRGKLDAAVKTEPADSYDVGKLKNYVTVVAGDKELQMEVCEKNEEVLEQMIADSHQDTEDLKTQNLSEQIVCIVCMKLFKKTHWFFFCRHLDEIHFMLAPEYRDLLQIASVQERSEKIQYFKDQRLHMKKRYKELKYNKKMEDLITCSACNSVLTSLSTFREHIKAVHLKSPEYPELVTFLEKLHDEKTGETAASYMLTCDYCGVEKPGINGLKVHMKMVHPEKDDILEKMNKHRERVKRLVQKMKRVQYHKEKEQGVKAVYCRYCSDKFTFRSSRGRHEKFSCEKNPDRVRLFTCHVCDGRFHSKEEVNIHRTQHLLDDCKFVCDICGVVRRTKAGIYEHKKTKHSDEPGKHQCPHCQKCYHSKERFRSHLTVHSDLRMHQCEVCGGSFKTRAAVIKHRNTVHYNKYQYYCHTCGHGVAKLAYLKTHKCGRIRRNQAESLKLPTVTNVKEITIHTIQPMEEVPSTEIQQQQQQHNTILLPELTNLPKMEMHDLVYDDRSGKEQVILETDIAAHILLGSSLQVNSDDIPTVSMPYQMEPNSQIVEVVQQSGDLNSQYGSDFGAQSVALIDYTNAPELMNRSISIHYAN